MIRKPDSGREARKRLARILAQSMPFPNEAEETDPPERVDWNLGETCDDDCDDCGEA